MTVVFLKDTKRETKSYHYFSQVVLRTTGLLDLPNVTASTTQHATKKRYAFLPPSTGGNENSASVALDSKLWLNVSCSWTVSSDTALLGVTSSMDVSDIEVVQS